MCGGDRVALESLADALVEARLLSSGRGTLEVAHEALLRLPPIGDWLEDDREFLIWRDRLSRARVTFEANERGLLVGRELQIAHDWLTARADAGDIAAPDRAFIAESIAEDDRHREEERAREHQRRKVELEAAQYRERAAQETAKIAQQMAEAARDREKAAQDAAEAAQQMAAAAKYRESTAQNDAKIAQQIAATSKRFAQRTLAGLAAVLVLAVALAVVAGWAIEQRQEVGRQKHEVEKQRDTATRQSEIAVAKTGEAQAAREEAVKARDAALLQQSQYLTALAKQETETERDPTTGLLLALEALPDANSEDPSVKGRPLWAPAEVSLEGARRALRELAVLKRHTATVRSVAVTPDGARIVTGSDDKTARLWELFPSGQALIEEVKTRAPRCLTPAERQRYHLAPMPPGWCGAMEK